MTIIDKPRPKVSIPAKRLPYLENGDRLTRHEFERRYQTAPKSFKAELVEGRVYMASPVSFDHGSPHLDINTWVGIYKSATSGVQAADNTTLLLDADNMVQPDLALWIEAGQKKRVRITEKGYLDGSPELIVEIAATSATYDLHDKLQAYRRNQIQEYIVWQVNDKRLDWFELVEGQYLPLVLDANGIIKSKVFPGLNLAVNDLLEGEMANVLAELQKGLASEEHVKFMQGLSGD